MSSAKPQTGQLSAIRAESMVDEIRPYHKFAPSLRPKSAVVWCGGGVAVGLCVTGLIAVFLTGYVGYFVVDKIWPTFYYTPKTARKNAWLAAQALSIGIYWLGVINILLNVRKITRTP